MNSKLISNGADKIVEASDSTAGLAGGRRKTAEACAEALFKSIGASGALANVIAKLTDWMRNQHEQAAKRG